MKNKVKVYGKEDFKRIVNDIDLTKEAVISIECSAECAKYWLEEEKGDTDNLHLLPSGPSVLNLDFDDIEGPGDKYYKGHWFRSFKEIDAFDILKFIRENKGKDLIIHCKAGKSRSKAIGQFILEFMGDEYEDGNPNNPIDGSCNGGVLLKLKSIFYSINHLYWCCDNRTQITKEAGEDLCLPVHFEFREEYDRGRNLDYEGVRKDDVLFLIGAIDGVDDYYWVGLTKEGGLDYFSCVGGYTVIRDYRQYPRLTEKDVEFPENIDMKEIKESIMNSVRRWDKCAKDWTEEQIFLEFYEG
jgi:hypothetical protein